MSYTLCVCVCLNCFINILMREFRNGVSNVERVVEDSFSLVNQLPAVASMHHSVINSSWIHNTYPVFHASSRVHTR